MRAAQPQFFIRVHDVYSVDYNSEGSCIRVLQFLLSIFFSRKFSSIHTLFESSCFLSMVINIGTCITLNKLRV